MENHKLVNKIILVIPSKAVSQCKVPVPEGLFLFFPSPSKMHSCEGKFFQFLGGR